MSVIAFSISAMVNRCVTSRLKGSWLINMAQMELTDENFKKIQQIQYVIQIEDGLEADLDETLARVLDFYREFVPYN